MRQNVINVMSYTLVRQSRPLCKSGTLINITQKLRSSVMLMIEQKLILRQKTLNIKKDFKEAFLVIVVDTT